MEIANKPTKVNKSEEITMIEKVQIVVFKINLELLNLQIETITEEKTIGITKYRPKFINNCVKNPKTSELFAPSKGRTKAETTPRAIPIKYLIQTFITSLYHILDCDSIVCYIINMSDILLIGKELPDVLEFAESISLKERRIFTTCKNATEVSNFEAENIFSATWNKNSAISARSLIIKAETKLDNLDEYLFYFDAPYFASKFELDKSEEVSAAIDSMISSYQYAINELLYRLEQKKEKAIISFLIKTASSKFDVLQAGNKNVNSRPVSNIVDSAQMAFKALAQNVATLVAEKSYLSVLLAQNLPTNELYENEKEVVSWLMNSINEIKNAKNKQTAKQACTWVKVGAKIPSGFSLFK